MEDRWNAEDGHHWLTVKNLVTYYAVISCITFETYVFLEIESFSQLSVNGLKVA